METLTDLDDLDGLIADDFDVPANFVWAPKAAQQTGTIQAFRHRPTERRAEDHRHRGALAGVLDPLPAPGESAHLVLPGNVPLGAVLWHIIDAVDPGPLAVSTLGFNRAWIAGLIDRLRSRTITKAIVICSDYFAKADAAEFQEALQLLAPWPVTLTAGRTHAKVGVFGPYSMEGSANLRSCRSTENVVVSNDQGLADFHRKWIHELAAKKPIS